MEKNFSLKIDGNITTVSLPDGEKISYAGINPRALRRDLNKFIANGGDLRAYQW